MRHRLPLALAVALFASAPVFAQHDEPRHEETPPHANGGHVPAPPPHREDPHAVKEVEHTPDGKVLDRPHVNNDHWYGHAAVDDKRFHLDHPFAHGHFEHFGPTYRYNVVRVDVHAHRFWLPGGFFFDIAAWDWAVAANWCWTGCGNIIVVYEDPDHPGWYMIYNTETGAYVHAQYMGA